MTTRTRTRITIQTRKTTLVNPLRLRCQQCGAEVPLVTPESAAGTLQTTPREIHGLLENGELHTVTEPSGENLICATHFLPRQPKPKFKSKEKDNEVPDIIRNDYKS